MGGGLAGGADFARLVLQPFPPCRRRNGADMPSSSLLDLDALIAPIPGDSPAGGPVPFAVREKLEEFRKEIDPASFAANDPMRPTSFQKADWSGIARLTEQALLQTSKDLLIAARLTEALTKLHGFAGLRDGLRLMRRLVVECWDRLNPAIESEDDLEIRARRSSGSMIPTAALVSQPRSARCRWSRARRRRSPGVTGSSPRAAPRGAGGRRYREGHPVHASRALPGGRG